VTQANTAQLKAELDAGEEILRTATLARLAYDGVDGTPRVIPIGFLWTGQAVVVATHPTAPKFAALRARPRVALTIDPPEPGALPAAARRGRDRGRRRAGAGVPRGSGEVDGGRGARSLRRGLPRNLRPDGADQHRPRLGALLRLRRRSLPWLPTRADLHGLRREQPALLRARVAFAELVGQAPQRQVLRLRLEQQVGSRARRPRHRGSLRSRSGRSGRHAPAVSPGFVWADGPRPSAQTPRQLRVSAGISAGARLAARRCRQ
jgi:hypothetical protein